jgi:uronate dehydrogenase
MPHDISTETWAITGAAGRIGTVLREGLRLLVAGLVLVDVLEINDLGPNEASFVVDVGDAAALREAFSGTAGVIHLAGIADEADFHDLAEVNIVGTWHVLEAARQAGATRIVYASTGRTFGMYDVTVTVSPDMPIRPDGLYAVSKVAGESLCLLYVDKFGMRATCLRIGAFKPAPETDRDLAIWLAPEDAVSAFVAGMTHEGAAFSILLAYSANEHGWVDQHPGRSLGYRAVENASDHRPGRPPEAGRQAGELADPAFTLDRQRPF